MSEAKNKRRRVLAGTNLAASSALLSAVLLAGCGSVGDAVNPVHWYNGVSDWVSGTPAKSTGDFPKVGDDKRPQTPSTKERTDLAKGLAADLANAKHTEESLHREGNPTRPLSAEAARPATSMVKLQPAAAPAAPPVGPPSLLKPTPADAVAPVETKPAAAAPAPAESNAAPEAPPAPPPPPAESKAAPVVPPAKTALTPPPVARAAVPPRVAE